MGTSVGAVIEYLKTTPKPPKRALAATGESFVAKERFSYVPNETLSATELKLLREREAILVDESGHFPNLDEAIRFAAVEVVDDELVRAKRARHTANVVAYVAELERSPRYCKLDLRAVEPPF